MRRIKNIAHWIYSQLSAVASPRVNTTPLFKYDTIDLPLHIFIDAMVDGDYSQVANFDDILNEYYECIGGKELLNQINQLKEITLLRTRVLLAQNIISFGIVTEDDFTDLKNLEYHLLLPAPALNDVEKYIEQITPWIKREALELKKLEREQEERSEKLQATVSYTRDYFADTILEINSQLSMNISESNSTRTYCRAVVKYKNHCEFINNQKQAA